MRVAQAKTHILAGSAAMDEVKSRIGGLANALEVSGRLAGGRVILGGVRRNHGSGGKWPRVLRGE